MVNSDLYPLLDRIPGVSRQDEKTLRIVDDENYYALGVFRFSFPESDDGYSIVYGVYKRDNSVAINFSVNFTFEEVDTTLNELNLLKLIDDYNRKSMGVKAHTLRPSDLSDDIEIINGEIYISFNTEIYYPPERKFLEMNLKSMELSLSYLANAPLSFSDHLKNNGVKHDYLNDVS